MNPTCPSVFLSVSALLLVAACYCILQPTEILAADHGGILVAPAAPTERPSSPPTWADDLDHRLSTYLKKKYPTYDFSPYTEELDRIRGAVSRRDRWAIKHEMGVFLKMLASRAYGLRDDAAEELMGLAQQAMPADEFAIVYPGLMTGVYLSRIGA